MTSVFHGNLFQGKTVVVTGGTSGIGVDIALRFAQSGARVIAAGLGAKDVRFTPELNIQVSEVDVTDDSQLSGLFSEITSLDILVPAAGISMGEKEMEYDNFLKVISVQLHAVYHTISLAHHLLAKSGNASIVNIASMYAFFGGGRQLAYSTAKGGIVQLTKSLAQAYAPDNIRVNAVAPGWIDTPLLRHLKEDKSTAQKILSRTPVNRFGLPEEVSHTTMFLCSDAASFINGVTLPVDGGYLVTGI